MRRNPPSTMASTIARSRHRRHAATSSSTSAGSRIFGRVRGVRTKGVPRSIRDRFRFDKPRGTGFASTSPHANKNPNRPEIDDNRRWIVRADNPDSPSANRTTLRSPR